MPEPTPMPSGANNTGNDIYAGMSPQEKELLLQGQTSQAQLYGYQAIQAQLFPGGLPPIASGTELGANPELLKMAGGVSPAAQAAGVSMPRVRQDQYVDPSTGAIMLANGVMIDTSATPETGVTFPNDDSIAGSPLWLRKVNDWSAEKVNKWRDRLRKLGYPVAKKGASDAGFLQNLGMYYRYKYFYGKEVPLDAAGEGALGDQVRAKDAYDPIQARFDAREALTTMFPGMEPSDAEVEKMGHIIMRAVRKSVANGATAQHAQLKGVQALDETLRNDPSAQLAQKTMEREEDANTSVSDSITGAFQILSSL